jgi:iron complex transport system substrate-binding protein
VAAGLRLALLVALRLRAGHAAAFGHASAPAIVSLNPCSDAILAEVADPGQVLALSHYSRDPRSSSMDVGLARRFPATRGTVEEVLALHPDLVLGDTFLGPAARAAYDRLGIPVTQLPIAMTVADSRAQVRRIAALAGIRSAASGSSRGSTPRWPPPRRRRARRPCPPSSGNRAGSCPAKAR